MVALEVVVPPVVPKRCPSVNGAVAVPTLSPLGPSVSTPAMMNSRAWALVPEGPVDGVPLVMFPFLAATLASAAEEITSPLTVVAAQARALGIAPDQAITRLCVPGVGLKSE